MEKEFLEQSSLANEILNTVGAIILAMDKDGRIVLFNRAAESLTDYSFDEVKGKYPWDIFILPEESERVRDVFARLTSGDFPNNHTNCWRTKGGEKRLLDWSNTALVGDSGEIQFIVATGVDITRQKQAEEEVANYQQHLEEMIAKRTAELEKVNAQLNKIARLDPTTGIFNRRHFDEILELEIRRCKRQGVPLSLLLCDIDYFKIYNDTYGHVAGDECLCEIATTLNQNLNRAYDTVCRYGGEEFVIILPDAKSEQALATADKLLHAIWEKQYKNEKSPISGVVTISVGVVSSLPKELSSGPELVAAADKALYIAKNAGRNNVQIYTA